MPYEMIVYEKKGPVATLTLNRPDTINAINPQMTAELHGALDEADADAGVRAIILTGAGRGFSAGFDIARRPDGRSSLDATGVEVAEYIKRWWARDRDSAMELLHLWHLTKPVIAAVHGWVMGGGSGTRSRLISPSPRTTASSRNPKFATRRTPRSSSRRSRGGRPPTATP